MSFKLVFYCDFCEVNNAVDLYPNVLHGIRINKTSPTREVKIDYPTSEDNFHLCQKCIDKLIDLIPSGARKV